MKSDKIKKRFAKWLLPLQLLKKLTYKFIHGRRGVLAGFGILNRLVRLREAQELSKLLSFETIKAKTFYYIQNKLSKIAKRQKELHESENPQQEAKNLYKEWVDTMSLLGGKNPKLQQYRWNDIVEQYSKYIDESSFEIFLRKKRRDIEWECDLAIMELGIMLAQFGDEEGISALNELGIKGTMEQMQSKIRGKITNRELSQSNNETNDDREVDFFVMMAKVRKDGYSVNSNVLLEEWVGILKNISDERNNSEK